MTPRTVTFGCVGDVHGRHDRVERVGRWLEGRGLDAVLVTGDFAPGGPETAAGALEATLDRLGRAAPVVLFVPGNHDPPDLEHPANVDGTERTVAGVRVHGIGGSPPTPARLPYEWPEEEMRDLEVPDCDVLLCHAPPAGTRLDVMVGGRHIGSRTVRRLAEGHAGALVCGHVHESAAAEVVGTCLCYNAGSLGPPEGAPQAGVLTLESARGAWTVEHHRLDGGPAWSADLVLPREAR